MPYFIQQLFYTEASTLFHFFATDSYNKHPVTVWVRHISIGYIHRRNIDYTYFYFNGFCHRDLFPSTVQFIFLLPICYSTSFFLLTTVLLIRKIYTECIISCNVISINHLLYIFAYFQNTGHTILQRLTQLQIFFFNIFTGV